VTQAEIRERIGADLLDRLAERVTSGGGSATFPVELPWLGEPLADLPLCTPEDAVTALEGARRSQAEWAGRTRRERARILKRVHDMVWAEQESLLDIIQAETGKSRPHAFEEVGDVAILARYYAFHGPRHLRSRRRRGGIPLLTSTREHHDPVGVVALISPWNYPLALSISDLLAVLMAGNGAVIKPDRLTPFTVLRGVDMLSRAGVPDGLVQVVTGRGAELAPPLIAGSDFLMFTGSTVTGRELASRAGSELIDATMELGGKNAMIVCADADLKKAARVAVWDCFTATGQLCVSIEKIFVEREVADTFTELFRQETGNLRLGAAFDYSAEMGSLISREQFAKVSGHVDEAVAAGARLITGGRARPELGPLFFEPTILADVPAGVAVNSEETFGPVVSLTAVDSIAEAVAAANDTPYGLNAAVWTRNRRRGLAIARELRAGTVSVNDSYRATWISVDAAQGGMKASGLGRRHGRTGLLKYTELQTTARQRLLPIGPPPGWEEERFHRLLEFLLKLLRRLPGLR